ncbi:hypothetical protein ABBQ32_002610 [Trebouxia sp. C0010 RCD-2024]
MLYEHKALEKSRALFPSYSYCAWPDGITPPGSHLYQNYLVSCFSTQHHHTQQEGPDISLLDPALQKQWDHARNAHLGSTVVKPYSNRKVWWTCDKCPDGHPHSWLSPVDLRSRGQGGPQCSSRKVCKHNSLATRAPKVASQSDHEVNTGTPDTVLAQSHRMFGWRCDACGHKWSAPPGARVSKQASAGCPMCALFKKPTKHPTFAKGNHPLLAEWDHDRNAAHGNHPDNVTLGSRKQIFWLCTKCPVGQVHSWSATPNDRSGRRRSGCPVCAGMVACRCNSLQALYPDIAAEWDHSKNRSQLSKYTAGSGKRAWWFTTERGTWRQAIYARTLLQKSRMSRLKRIQQQQRVVSKP